MTGSRLVLWLARATIVASLTAWSLVGCSRQAEGERCDREAAVDTDCNEGLKCIPCADLWDHKVDRCCPPQAGSETDGRCQRSTSSKPELCQQSASGGTGSGTGGRRGTGGTGAMSGGGGEAGTPDGGQ